MDPIIKSYADVLESLHEEFKKQISGLTQEELDWSPGADMNSLAILAAHIAGSERYWIGDHIMGTDSGRVREQEFATSGATEDALSDPGSTCRNQKVTSGRSRVYGGMDNRPCIAA